jgi:serine protease Do
MDQLVKSGRVDRGGIGVTMAPLTPANAKVVGYEGADGVIIDRVQPDSPAAKAGLRRGDVVVHYNGKAVNSVNRLTNFIAFTTPGTTAQFDIVREGSGMKVEVPVADRDDIIEGNRADKNYGFTVRTLPGQIAQRYRRNGAVVVQSIEQGGPAANTSPTALETNDIIVSVNGIETPDAAAFDRAVARVGKVRLRLDVIRGGTPGTLRSRRASSGGGMQTLAQIRALLEAHGLSPRKSLGQNFLIDQNLIRKLVDASGVHEDDLVLEVGPGTGALTEELLARGCPRRRVRA